MNTRTALAVAAAAIGIAVILVAVGGPAAVTSYHHAYRVFVAFGEEESRAAWLPLTTDGMLAAALVVMYARRWAQQPVGKIPWLAFVVGFIGTLAANLASSDAFTAPTLGVGLARVAVAVWPPIVFAVTLELVAVMLGRVRGWILRRRPAVDTWPATWLVGIPEYPYRPPAAEPESAPAPVERERALDHLTAAILSAGAPPAPAPRKRTRRSAPAASAPGAPAPATNGKATRWTEQDEALRIELQEEVHRSGALPSVRSVKTTYSIGQDRAAKIVARLTLPSAPAQDEEPVR